MTALSSSIRHGNNRRPGHRLRDDRDVRGAGRDWSRCLPSHHHPAVCRWADSAAA